MRIHLLISAIPRWGRRLLAGVAGLVALYAATGFLVLPAVVRSQAPGRLGRLLGRPVQVGRVRCNPFTLAVAVEDFSIGERNGGEFLGFDRLRVGLGWSSLWSRAITLRELELARPRLRVVVLPDGRFNFSDLQARLTSGAPASQGPARPLRIGRLAIQGARVDLQDRATPEPFATTLGPLGFELTGFSTEPDRTSPYAFTGRTEAGETFHWNGTLSLDPLASRGHFSLERLQLGKYHPFFADRVAFRVAGGTLSAQAGYTFRWAAGVHEIRLADGAADLQGLALAAPRPAAPKQPAPDLALDRIQAGGIQADLVGSSVTVGTVRVQGGRIRLVRDRKGDLNLVRLLTPLPPKQPEPPSGPFHLALQQVDVGGLAVDFLDQAPERPVRAAVTDLAATLRDFTLDPAGQARLDLDLRLDGQARLRAQGTVTPFRPAADLQVKVERLALPPFDPYLAPDLAIRLNRGTLDLEGRLRASFAPPPAGFTSFQGRLHLDRFEAADAPRREPFLAYRSLTLTGLDVRTNPLSLAIASVDLVGPAPRLVLAADGTSNVGRALRLEPEPVAAKPLAAAGAALPPSPATPLRLSIGRTRIADGRLSFVDRTLEPNAALLITGLAGTAASLSTTPDNRSVMDFRGLAGGIAPLRIQGHALPLRKDQDTDVNVTVRASELTDFSPYVGKYLGYTVAKGKLDVDARFQIQQRQLHALLKAKLDQFYLGERTGSKDATHLPVKLCLAILRDRHGVIDLELPVDGSLDDPNLHYGKIVWKALENVLVKVATAPFAWIGKLGGSGHDLSYAAFEPGSAEPGPEAVAKAQDLAKALAEHPDLGLEAEGTTDPVADPAALRHQALERLLAELRAAGGAAPGPVPPAERGRWLEAAFRKRFPAPAAGAPLPPAAEMEQRLLGSFPVTGDQLNQLADRRTKAILALFTAQQVDPGRLFEVSGKEPAKAGGARVYFGLR